MHCFAGHLQLVIVYFNEIFCQKCATHHFYALFQAVLWLIHLLRAFNLHQFCKKVFPHAVNYKKDVLMPVFKFRKYLYLIGQTLGRLRADFGQTPDRLREDSRQTSGRSRADSGQTRGRLGADSGQTRGRLGLFVQFSISILYLELSFIFSIWNDFVFLIGIF